MLQRNSPSANVIFDKHREQISGLACSCADLAVGGCLKADGEPPEVGAEPGECVAATDLAGSSCAVDIGRALAGVFPLGARNPGDQEVCWPVFAQKFSTAISGGEVQLAAGLPANSDFLTCHQLTSIAWALRRRAYFAPPVVNLPKVRNSSRPRRQGTKVPRYQRQKPRPFTFDCSL